jgi:hypothetical protein
MQRYRHPNGWCPPERLAHWFEYWDICRHAGCNVTVQHYVKAKRSVTTLSPNNPARGDAITIPSDPLAAALVLRKVSTTSPSRRNT